MRPGHSLRWFLAVGAAIVWCVCVSLSHAGTSGETRSAIGPVSSGVMGAPTNAMTAEPSLMQEALLFRPLENAAVLRTIPTLSKQMSVRGTTLVPFIGAGFGGGYVTELDRSLNAVLPASSFPSGLVANGAKNLLGPHLIPNEVQLGIRFPF